MDITFAATRSEKDSVYRLRYDVFSRELGRQLPGTDHSTGTIIQAPDEYADILIMKHNDELVGSIRFVCLADYAFDTFYKIDISHLKQNCSASEIANASLLCLRKKFRGKGIAEKLAPILYEWARKRHIRFSVSIAPQRCLSYYRRFGYTIVGESTFCADYNEPLCPISVDLCDISGLVTLNSPFVKTARSHAII